VPAPPPSDRSASAEAPVERLPNSVAVLPFENLSPNPDDAFFAAGIHEEILNQLAKIHDLTVIARTSVLPYAGAGLSIPEIAAELRVGAVMEGSVRYAGERVRVTAQLIDASTGAHLWSEAYDRNIDDVFAIQADIATQIARALEAEMLPQEQASIEQAPTESTEAYAWYLRRLSLPSSVRFPAIYPSHLNFLDQAIAIDPSYAMPYAAKARLYAEFAMTPEDMALARQNAERALSLDPTIGQAYVALAILSRRLLRELDERSAFESAIAVSPLDSEVLIEYGRFLSTVGEYDEAIRMGERAAEIDPNSAGVRSRLGDIYELAGDLDGAVIANRAAIELNPSLSPAYASLAEIAAVRGDRARGLELIVEAERTWASGALWVLEEIITASGRLGRVEETQRLNARLEEMAAVSVEGDPAPYLVHGAIAVRDRALALERLTELVRLVTETDAPLDWDPIFRIKTNWAADPMLDEPEFIQLRERLGHRD